MNVQAHDKIVFFDIDGTLLNKRKQIPSSTRLAIRLLQEQGIMTAIATGRTPFLFAFVREQLRMDSYVSINGQYVVLDGQPLYTNPMDTAMLDELSAMAVANNHPLAFCSEQLVTVTVADHPYINASLGGLNIPHPPVEHDYYKRSPVYQCHLFCNAEEEAEYIRRFPDLSFVRWHELASDVLPAGCSKAVGIRKILEARGIPRQNSYAFGDGLNDIEMLSYVGTGIAMGNAEDEAKAAADFVTASIDEDGILRGLIRAGLIEANAMR